MESIYMIKNKINGMMYIGKTSRDIYVRWGEHKRRSRKPEKYKNDLGKAIREYGEDNFDCILIEECSFENVVDRERYWIKEFDSIANGYNKLKGGEGGSIERVDRKMILENFSIYKKMSDMSKEFNCSEKTIRKIIKQETGINPQQLKSGKIEKKESYTDKIINNIIEFFCLIDFV